MPARPIFVVAGGGNSSGTGGAAAHVFSKAGYRVALIARQSDSLTKFAQELNSGGAEAAPFAVSQYDHKEIHSAFDAIRKHWPNEEIRVALFNTGFPVFKPFLQITEEDIDQALQFNLKAAFSFAREAILSFQDLPLNEQGKRGTLLFTGATAGLKGNVITSAFSAAKFGVRSLSQSLNKEFSKQNIHVAHAVIDGQIATADKKAGHDQEWIDNPDNKLLPESIAKSYLYLVNQDRSAWTWELDLRPAHEKW